MEEKQSGGASSIGVIIVLVGIVIIIMTFIGAGKMTEYGEEMASIQLAARDYDTIEEAYYEFYGEVITGFALVLRAFGIALGLIVGYIGTKIKK